MRKANTGVIVPASNNWLSFVETRRLPRHAEQRFIGGVGSKGCVRKRFNF